MRITLVQFVAYVSRPMYGRLTAVDVSLQAYLGLYEIIMMMIAVIGLLISDRTDRTVPSESLELSKTSLTK